MSPTSLSQISSELDPRGDRPATIGVSARVFRRDFLIDPRRQLRTALMLTALVVLLLIPVNIGFHLLRTAHTSALSAAVPELTPVLAQQNATSSIVLALLSLSLILGVMVATIVETHRTAGAVFALKQRLDRVREGDYRVTLRLRRRDNLQDLEQPFDAMVAALRQRALEEASTLDRFALRAEELGSDGADLAGDLRAAAEGRRETGS